MILKRDDGTSGVSPTCFSMATTQPSIMSLEVLTSRGEEHALEHDGRHCTCRCVFI